MIRRPEPVRTCCEPPPRRLRAVPPVVVITSVRDIPHLCTCEWAAPDYAQKVRTWTRVLNPACTYCLRSGFSAAEMTGVAA